MGEDASLDDFLDADDQEVDQDDGDADANTGQMPTSDGSADEGTAEEGTMDTSSVDESATGEPGTDDTEAPDGEDAADGAETATDGHDVEPTRTTYDWTPGGAACEACDEVVERRWRDDPGFVCENCKDW